MCSGEGEGAVGQPRREVGHCGPERREIVRLQADREAVRHDRSSAVAGQALFHGPLEPPLNLDRADRRSEQPRGLALEEPFEEVLDGGKGSHVGGGV